ncbi:putative lipoprotein [Neisseria gonorrhoeae]|uniref:Putative lipoprotein n=1 Tax=Neisseria gonorrhoeae TaxID=485 RepID=A0A378VUK5_NEIGO|nr:putative lipoprotein [Neisseria gonorrhoeae]
MTYSDTLKQLGGQAKDVKVVFVSIDPERDTPEIIGKYAKQFNPDFIGLTATGGQNLPVIKQQYRVVSAKSIKRRQRKLFGRPLFRCVSYR